MSESPELYLTREAVRLLSDRQLRRARERGTVVRLAAGVFVPAAEWAALDLDQRYRTRVRAIALRARLRPQISHDSAAALWRLPSVGPWPSTVHEVIGRNVATSSRVGVTRHARDLDPDCAEIDDTPVTSLARTLVDMSCTTTFVRAVAMVDDGLRAPREGDPRWGWPRATADLDATLRVLDSLEPYGGSVRARRVLQFATALSGSPGESVARVQFLALGYPAPALQFEFRDEDGFIGFADFYWPALGLAVEFDGRSKYGSERRYQRELSSHQVLMHEKAREDRMRRVVESFARIDWAQVSDRRRLASRLQAFGLKPNRRSLSGQTAPSIGIF